MPFTMAGRRASAPALLSVCIQMSLLALLPTHALAQSQPAATQQLQRYDLPAQPLTSAIQQYSRISGVQVIFSTDDGEGLTSAAVHGDFNADRALHSLLAGTGLTARFDAGGRQARLEPLVDDESGLIFTPALNVQGQNVAVASGLGGQTSYGQQQIRATATHNGHITSLLRMNPAVQFDNSASSSKTPGDLEPADISIHGAKFWQNSFMVDGMSVNNDLNPGDRSYYNANGSLVDLPGNKSQGIALDIGLIEKVDVYDSNVSAEYGGFNGGVVNAITRDPSDQLRGSLSVASTRDAWSKYHIDERAANSFYNGSSFANGYVRTQPEFKTMTYRLNLEGKLTDDFGLLGSFTRKHSDIYNQRVVNASMADSGYTLSEFTDVERRIDNYFLKGVYTPDERLRVEAVVTHEPQESGYFTINAMDGDFDMESGGSTAGVTVTWWGDRVTQTHKLTWSELEHSRTGGPGWYQSWYYSDDKNWGDPTATGAWASMYGTFGNIHQGQDTLDLKSKFEWDPVSAGAVEHRFAAGFGITDATGWYQRKEDFTQGNQMTATSTCTDINGNVDDRHCSTAPVLHLPSGWPEGSGQMAGRLNVYREGRISVDQRSWSAWVEDAMAWNRFDLRLGLRVDGDDYMDKTNVAPRVAAEYDLSGTGNTRLVAGANRYYGRNMYEYALSAERMLMQYHQIRDPDTMLWSDPVRSVLSTTAFSQLDVPYDNELMVGIRQVAWGLDFDLKYVNRKGRDQVVRQLVQGEHEDPLVSQTSHYEYLNAGRSDTDSLMLTVTPLRPFEFAGTSTSAQLIANWVDVTSSHENYRTTYDEVADNAWIRYNGDFIRYYERPANNYNRPWTLRISTLTEIPDWNLSIGNYLGWRGSYRRVVDTGLNVDYNGETADVYEEYRYGTSVNWDVRLMWDLPLGRHQELFANLDITNLLDKTNTATWSSSEVVYEIGRQFHLELGYRF